MQIVSWNVNGLKSLLKSHHQAIFKEEKYDIFCLQEVKMQENLFSNVLFNPKKTFWNTAKKNGYSGVATITPSDIDIVSISNIIFDEEIDREGRVLCLEFVDFILVNTYAPHSHRKLIRLDVKKKFCQKFIEFLKKLKEKFKPIIIAGDLNVAHNEIDLYNFKNNKNNAGFLDLERAWFENLLELGFVDAFRYLHPEKRQYSWWGFAHNLRERNVGWRLDYFLVDNSIENKIVECYYLENQIGSDHCPVVLNIHL